MTTRARYERNMAWLFIAPGLLVFLIFLMGPLLFSLGMSFTNWDLTIHNSQTHTPIQFVGFQHFQALFSGDESRYFWPYLSNTLILMIGIPISIGLSLFLALLLSQPLAHSSSKQNRRGSLVWVLTTLIASLVGFVFQIGPFALTLVVITGALGLIAQFWGSSVFRTVYYLPNLTAGVPTYILWKSLYRAEQGPINRLIEPILNLLQGWVLATPTFLWRGLGFAIGALMLALFLKVALGIYKHGRHGHASPLATATYLLLLTLLTVFLMRGAWLTWQLPEAVQLGLRAPEWLSNSQWSKPALILMGIFMAAGSNNMLLYLAALTHVPQNLHEAAALDGANAWQRFLHVTWPQLMPTTFFILIMSLIGGLQGGFDQARIMTQGGPAGSTTTLAYYLYQRGFEDFRFGFASAIAWTLFAMVFCFTLATWRFGKSSET